MTDGRKNWPRRRNNLHAKWVVGATCTCPNFSPTSATRKSFRRAFNYSLVLQFFATIKNVEKTFSANLKEQYCACVPLFSRFSLICLPMFIRCLEDYGKVEEKIDEARLPRRVSPQALLKMNWYENLTIKLEDAGQGRTTENICGGKEKYWFESRPQLKVGTGDWRRKDYERRRWRINWRNWKFRPQPDKSKEIVSWLRFVITTLQWSG